VNLGGFRTRGKGSNHVTHRHLNHSPIDYFLVSCSLLPNVAGSGYDIIVLSDHSPVSLFYMDTKLVKRSSRWCLHPRWLQDPDVLHYVGVHIDVYFTLNTDQTSASTRWEAFKACIIGQLYILQL
jgi:hypothetical protein